jgi:ABC-type polysaccharide/polyol phosphate transport system ATPase subunit
MSILKLSKSIPVPSITLEGICKFFYLYEKAPRSLRELFIKTAKAQIEKPLPYFAIKDLSFTIYQGETVALIGSNGSGKSSVLRMIAGIYYPSKGRLTIDGSIGSVIELGAGFSPELTGKENIRLYGQLIGLTNDEINRSFSTIVDFSEIDDFINIPVKFYSSGMVARLAFSIALSIDPDILLLDEVLAVGDEQFRKKCWHRLTTHQSNGGTLLIVTHDLETVRNICDKVLWLEKGELVMTGNPDEVINKYLSN